jgi:hypothetical protein
MRFKLVTGRAFTVTCLGCQSNRMAGSEPYYSASTGKMDGQPDKVYIDLEDDSLEAYFCEACAVNHVGYEDTTRSVSKFFADTEGKEIL